MPEGSHCMATIYDPGPLFKIFLGYLFIGISAQPISQAPMQTTQDTSKGSKQTL